MVAISQPKQGNLTSYTDPEQNTTLYAYDDLNRVILNGPIPSGAKTTVIRP